MTRSNQNTQEPITNDATAVLKDASVIVRKQRIAKIAEASWSLCKPLSQSFPRRIFVIHLDFMI